VQYKTVQRVNTLENNSNVFSLIMMYWLSLIYVPLEVNKVVKLGQPITTHFEVFVLLG